MACGVLQIPSFPAGAVQLCKVLLSGSVEVPSEALPKYCYIWCTGDGELLSTSFCVLHIAFIWKNMFFSIFFHRVSVVSQDIASKNYVQQNLWAEQKNFIMTDFSASLK